MSVIARPLFLPFLLFFLFRVGLSFPLYVNSFFFLFALRSYFLGLLAQLAIFVVLSYLVKSIDKHREVKQNSSE